MRVLINRLLALRQKTGIGHYIAQLLESLSLLAGNDQILVYPGPCAAKSLDQWKRFRNLLRKGNSPQKAGKPSNRVWLGNLARRLASWHFRLFGAGQDFDLYHEPNYIPFPCDRPTVATIHDLSVVLHPQWHPPDRAAFFEKHFQKRIAGCVHLLADCECIRREIVQHLHVPPERITSAPPGIRPEFRPLPKETVNPVLTRLGLPSQYLLYVGTLEPRKNLLMLLKAFVDLPAQVRQQCPLVLAGGWGWNVHDLAEFYHARAKHRGVWHLGYLRDEDLPALYNGARALVLPSYYEGFGFPPLEMMACGGAVLASTAKALVETVGPKAFLIDPEDYDGWRQALIRIIQDNEWRQSLRSGSIETARPYTWIRCAQRTWEVYRSACGQTPIQEKLPTAA